MAYKTATWCGLIPAGDLFQCKIELPNVFHITDDIFIVGYDDDNGRDYDRTQKWDMQICCKETY